MVFGQLRFLVYLLKTALIFPLFLFRYLDLGLYLDIAKITVLVNCYYQIGLLLDSFCLKTGLWISVLNYHYKIVF